MSRRRITLRVQPPMPLGDVAVVPAGLSGRTEADLARAMAVATDAEAPTAADVHRRLLRPFPSAPLSGPVAGLGSIIERLRRL